MKKSIPILIVLLLINLAFFSSVSAESPKSQGDTLTIWLPGITEDDYFVQIEVTNEQKEIFYNELNGVLDVINVSISEGSPQGKIITEEEWDNIAISIDDSISFIKQLDENFPEVDTNKLVTDIIEAFFDPFGDFLPPDPLFSIGTGYTIIPFYNYESFLGRILRPTFTRHIVGFARIGGFFDRYMVFGTFSMITIAFAGLFVNLGDIGFDRILGPTLYIGTAMFVLT